jgi:Arc/MetJ-type ribon-helix-helix transcriptional regulator
MKREMVNFDDETGEWVEEQVEAGEFSSKSELIQHFFDVGRRAERLLAEKDSRIDELEERIEDKEGRIDELEEQLARRSQLEDEISALPDKIRDDMSYQERRQRMLDQATFSQRLKWRFTGVPVEQDDNDSDSQ